MSKTESIRLTRLTSKGGCAAKWSPTDLKAILGKIVPPEVDPAVLLGFETSDDAAVYKLRDDLAAVLTVDFFTPVVDDPYEYGCVAAANALSDVFAMGAKPHVALNLLALDSQLGTDIAGDIIQGGSDKVHEAGAFTMGGHTIDDDEPKYGLCVFGTVHPDKVVRNAGAQPGDVLFLTKPLGTGIMSAAHKIGMISDEEMHVAIEFMMELNLNASEAMLEAGAHAATDVTGFGLAGHLHEMMEASGCSALLDWESLPTYEQVWRLTDNYCRPNRLFSTMDYCESFLFVEGADETERDNRTSILCDPQTSGGLLVSIPAENAEAFVSAFETRSGRKPARIGVVTEGDAGVIRCA